MYHGAHAFRGAEEDRPWRVLTGGEPTVLGSFRTPAAEDRAILMHANPLAAIEQSYRLLVEAVVDYAIYLLYAKGRVATWNPGAERIKGYSREEAIGQPFSLFFTE
jgi:PAS domain-containing protein